MKTRDKQLSAKGPALLLSVLAVLAVGVRTFAQEQESSRQGVDLTEMSLQDLMNIEVVSTATLTKTTPRLVPAAVTTITAEQIKASGARSLYELLDIYVPNLQILRHHWDADHMGLRGIIGESDDKYLLLVNGRNMNEHTRLGALTERDLVLLTDIHHIDVVRGPGSAMYGPGAVSMVINIITYNSDTFQGTEATTRVGVVEEFYSAELKHGQKFNDEDGGMFMYAGISKYLGASKYDAAQIFSHDFGEKSWAWDGPYAAGTKSGEPMTGKYINRDGADARNLPELKLHAQIKRDNWDIWARYTRGGKQFNWNAGQFITDPYGWTHWIFDPTNGYYSPVGKNFYTYQQATGYIGYKQELADSLDIDYAFSYKTTDFAEYRMGGTHNAEMVDDAHREDEYYGKILSQWQPNEQHKIAFGVEASHRVLGLQNLGWPFRDPIGLQMNPMSRWSTNLYSLLGEWQWNINDKWTTFVGGRTDDHTYTDQMFSPRAAIVHTPTDRDTLKLMWSRSVRANGEEQMKKAADASAGNSDPEKLDSVELRYERQQNKNLDLAASLFVHYNLEVLSWDGATLQTVPCGTQREYGLELEASYHTEKTRLLLSHGYTKLYGFYLESGQHTYLTAMPFGYGDDLAGWSNHITKLTLQHKLDDKWTFDASMRIYWGFPGMKDSDRYWPYNSSPAYVGTNLPMIEDGWEKTYRGDYYLNMGLQYKASEDLTIGVMGYNLLGIINRDFNKRNYTTSNGYSNGGDYRCYAPAVGVSLTYKF